MKPTGVIQLTRLMPKASNQRTRHDSFYVYDELPFDIVLGKQLMRQEMLLVWKQGLGLIKQGRFTAGKNRACWRTMESGELLTVRETEEMREIEKSIKDKGASNSEISSLHRATDAAAREARRQQKASRATTRGTNTPFSLGLVSRPSYSQWNSGRASPNNSVLNLGQAGIANQGREISEEVPAGGDEEEAVPSTGVTTSESAAE